MEAVDVVGAGAIGVTVGYALLAGGVPVRFVDKDARKVAAGKRHGVRLGTEPPRPAEFLLFDHWQPQPDRWVILCTKCYDNAAVLERLTPRIPLLPIQNGLDPVLEAFPHSYAGVAAFVAQAQQDEPTARITRRGPLYVGRRHDPERNGPGGGKGISRGDGPGGGNGLSHGNGIRRGDDSDGGEGAAALVAALRRSGHLRVRWKDDIRPIQATKLWYNAAIAPLAPLAGVDNAALLEHPALRRLFVALLQENYRILCQAGVPLGWLGPLPPSLVARVLRCRPLVALLAPVFARSLRGTYCSMSGDLARGRTEVDAYTGSLLHLARQAGIPAPLNTALYELLQQAVACRLRPHSALVEPLLSLLPQKGNPAAPQPLRSIPNA
jgi:2-dehydropantoate 2-reductase